MREIKPSEEKTIRENYRKFIELHPDLQFGQKSPQERGSPGIKLVQDLERNAQIALLEPANNDPGANGLLLRWLKRRIQVLAQPFMKLLFRRQQRFNDNLVIATYYALSLEDRVSDLELKLSQLQGNLRG